MADRVARHASGRLAAPWRVEDGGIVLAVRVTPRASRSAFAGAADAALAVRLSAPPVDGAANGALIELVARTFAVPKRDVTLLAGDTARLKRLRVRGDPVALAQVAQRLYAGAHDG